MRHYPLWLIVVILSGLLAGCGGKKESDQGKRWESGTLITVIQAKRVRLDITQEAVGMVESRNTPVISAEVSGRIVRVAADVGDPVSSGQLLAEIGPEDIQISRKTQTAEVHRLQSLTDNQERVVHRYQQLSNEGLVPAAELENAESQLKALQEETEGAGERLSGIERDLQKTHVIAPVSGVIEQRRVTVGDFVRSGDPLFLVTNTHLLQIRLPFPETAATQIHPGQTARLYTPASPKKSIVEKIDEIRPSVGPSNRSIEAIIRLSNPGNWKPGASVTGTVFIAAHRAIVVPEAGVVRRPAGEVVYVIRGEKAEQRVVQTGIRKDGSVEILSGLNDGETIALDGAGFLTDQAKVRRQGPRA
jgi:RND family efflux transporter MFP subunit